MESSSNDSGSCPVGFTLSQGMLPVNKNGGARNPVMASVGRCIREQHEILIKEEIPCTLEWNEGNHFVDAPVRSAKAFSWCIQTIKKKQNQ